MNDIKNDLELDGIEFVEFSSAKPENLHNLFKEFGFSKINFNSNNNVDHYKQGNINFLLNNSKKSYAFEFTKKHGPSIPSMGWRVKDAQKAFDLALERGASAAEASDYSYNNKPIPAISGIGGSLIYFIEDYNNPDLYKNMGFSIHPKQDVVPSKGFLTIDHLTNNVDKGTMQMWSDFYKDVFGFYEIRYFDIKGAKTGLTSYALQSPCGKFAIPINEGNEEKSQINEYLREYDGPGIQHIAFTTDDIVKSISEVQKSKQISFLDIDPEYYDEVFERVPKVTEDHESLKKLNILVDGDEEGYLLQIFTQNIVGPIFIEVIQRKNHNSFGEGNFGALFRAIERDQEKRGVL